MARFLRYGGEGGTPWEDYAKRRFSWGSALPAHWTEGGLHFLTGVANPCWFFYDTDRNKWLDTDGFWIHFYATASTAATSYLALDGARAGSAAAGYLCPYDATLCELNVNAGGTVAGTNNRYYLMANGAPVAQTFVNVGLAFNRNQTLNVNVNQDDVLAAQISLGTTPGITVVSARFRRRAA